MPQKSLNYALDINKDFIRPRSLTLTSEEIQNIPQPEKAQSGSNLEDSIKMNLKNMGLLRGWTKIRRAFGGEELGKNVIKKEEKSERKKRSLKPAFVVSYNQAFKRSSKGNSVSDEHGFSPQASMNTVPSPSMHASLSTPEYTNSEVDSSGSGDVFSDISGPFESPVIGSKERGSLSPRQLKKIVIQPQIFEFSDDDEEEDVEGSGNDENVELLQEKVERIRLPHIKD